MKLTTSSRPVFSAKYVALVVALLIAVAAILIGLNTNQFDLQLWVNPIMSNPDTRFCNEDRSRWREQPYQVQRALEQSCADTPAQ